MNRHVNTISARLSLCTPQRKALEILADITEQIDFSKETDAVQTLEIIRNSYPNVTDFERDFPSLCFALATGVGKTRLMGAFIAYLNSAKGIKHFFVLAPNLTIYNKLITDFAPEFAKYVLKGIAEFTNTPPEIITGDNYESGRGIREERKLQRTIPGMTASGDPIHINIFNISKINSEVRGGKAPRIKRLSEYIGESYFNYLAGLEDLVLIMDESHRYRGSAGINAINELKPILGLELIATPQIEKGTSAIPFKNIIQSYPLSQALADGFVKEPAVATRENFNPAQYSPEQLETIKLEDGIRIHESTKVDLETFTRQNDLPPVKPFMLVVARDTDHAETLVRTMKEEKFFGGRYTDKVITVHSNQRGEEADETVKSLLAVESPEEKTEIVIHVNMLKEGWDVTNLYTIVPLRAANSKTLVEQSIGRGLRLPFGKRVNYKPADRLTIVAHDKFSEIVDEANRPDSALKIVPVYIGVDVAVEPKKAVTVEPNIITALFGDKSEIVSANGDGSAATNENAPVAEIPQQPKMIFENPRDPEIAVATFEVIKKYERLNSSAELKKPEFQAAIVREIKENLPLPVQASFSETEIKSDYEKIVEQVTNKFVEMTIDIPRIIIEPKSETVWTHRNFQMDVSIINYPPVSQDIIIKSLENNEIERLSDEKGLQTELKLENYLVKALIDYEDISYDDHADLLYDLSRQVIAHLHSYFETEEQVHNVLQFYQKQLAGLIHAQMIAHQTQNATDYEANVTKVFITLRSNNYSVEAHEAIRNFRTPVDSRQNIRSMHFGEFSKCLYPTQKFDSDSERRLAIVLEEDPNVMKWFKPNKGQFKIYLNQNGNYEPDFVVETNGGKFLCEVKRADHVADAEVENKANAARQWCEYASRHEAEHGGKAWRYILIPHNSIFTNSTFAGIASGNFD